MSQHGIVTIGDFKALNPDQFPPIREIEGIHYKATDHFRPGQSQNPYQSKYGERWQEQLKSCPALSPLRSISDLVDFIAEEPRRLMEGSVHQDYWVFNHGLLSLFTSKE